MYKYSELRTQLFFCSLTVWIKQGTYIDDLTVRIGVLLLAVYVYGLQRSYDNVILVQLTNAFAHNGLHDLLEQIFPHLLTCVRTHKLIHQLHVYVWYLQKDVLKQLLAQRFLIDQIGEIDEQTHCLLVFAVDLQRTKTTSEYLLTHLSAQIEQ